MLGRKFVVYSESILSTKDYEEIPMIFVTLRDVFSTSSIESDPIRTPTFSADDFVSRDVHVTGKH